MLELLRKAISENDFEACWPAPPPYDAFLDSVAQKIGEKVIGQVTDISCSAKSDGDHRIRLDGVVVTSNNPQYFYADIVWLPKMQLFRGTVSLKKTVSSEIQVGSTDDETLVPVFVPTLRTLLAEMERKNGIPLTKEEVLAIRNKAICIALRPSVAAEMNERRGYRDIDPENCWEEWLALRTQLPTR